MIPSRQSRLLSLFASPGSQVGLGRSGTDYNLFQQLAAGLWWKVTLANDGTHNSLYQSIVGIPMLSADDDDAEWVFYNASHVVTAWTAGSNVNAYGGAYVRTSLTGYHAEFTAPAGTTSVGLRYFATTNAGLALVAIDGDKTAATNLPTAQDLVTAGTFPNTILVANGGTLSPTDRVLDMYAASGNADTQILLAKGLASGSHVVRVTVTGYKRAASTDVRVYVSGGMYGSAAITPATASMSILALQTYLSSSSVYEYAFSCVPTAGGTIAFIGNRHGGEGSQTLAFTIDGATVTPSDGSVTLGSVVTVTRTTQLSHGDLAHVADVSVVYTLRPGTGLRVDIDVDWLQNVTHYNAYVGMCPSQGNNFPNGSTRRGETVSLLDDDGSLKAANKSAAGVLWNTSGYALLLSVPDLAPAVNGWVKSLSFMTIEDRSTGDFNKLYLQRTKSDVATEAVTAADRWTWAIDYRVACLAHPEVLAVA